ncbi:hypothetical protein TW1_026 [Pseudoalteromonas phage TW1]|uniref:hypothetical protein n=1 Tax=Pseudoalteromonas phage TW1 TaxID=1366055 RepID=UPI00035AB3F5|nr:hypothetical protein PP585_gp26 [Pseudoalteromonas phage TW1]AGR46542.1 hypothetical protein TW1_026 [Pseudoalteromonas phage TW1]
MLRQMLNRYCTENRILKKQLSNNRFLSFVSWIGFCFLVGIQKGSFIPVTLFAILVYLFLFHKGKL